MEVSNVSADDPRDRRGLAGMCFALSARPAPANDRDTRPASPADAPAPMIVPHAGLDISPAPDETHGFVSATDVDISSPPAYITSATLDSPTAPPSATATAIPLDGEQGGKRFFRIDQAGDVQQATSASFDDATPVR